MGRITSEPQTESTKTHFSHEHPLKLITYQRTLNLSSACSGCKRKPSGTIYSCTTCDYFLHKQCFEMPKKITHPFHKDHSFILLPEPAYAEGIFNCDACSETGKGFSYHCKPCGIDLHILCAAMPLSVTHGGHMHKLELTFESPYDTKNFCCDICKAFGSNHWLYRCKSCGFDAHLNCARGASPVSGNCMGFPPPSPPQAAATFSRSAPPPQTQNQNQCFGQQYVGPTPHPMQHNFVPNPMMNNAAAIGVPAGAPMVPPLGVNRQNELLLQTIQQMINNNNTMTQAILAGGAGGFGNGFGGGLGGVGGFDRGSQQLMQVISALNNGGGIPGLNAFAGGGGVDVLQSLLGGGGGLDFLGGGGGGGGGLDFLGGLLGGFGF